MKGMRKVSPILRATSIISIVLALVTGVTYAALQSQNVKLSGNTIQSATANLLIGTTAGSMSGSSAGFSFTNVEPGGPAVPSAGNMFYLQNNGSTNLTLHMSVDQFTNSGNIDLTKVSILLTPISGGTPQSYTLATLVDSYNSGGTNLSLTLPSGVTGQYKLQAKMDADAISGGPSTGGTIGSLEFVFSGVTSES